MHQPAPLAAASDWLRFYERLWSDRFAALDTLIERQNPGAAPPPAQNEKKGLAK